MMVKGHIKIADKWQIGSLSYVDEPTENKGTGNQNE